MPLNDNSEYDLLYGALAEAFGKQHRKSNSTWNCPRRTKAVDSLGRIEQDPQNRKMKMKKKMTSQRKCRRRYREKLQRYRRLQELAKPKLLGTKVPHETTSPFKVLGGPSRKGSYGREQIWSLQEEPPEDDVQVKKGALKYRVTLKTSSLAKPKERDPVQERNGPSRVKNSALRYRITEHTAKLAEPKARYEISTRLPGKVVETALYATASKRVNELATPRKSSRAKHADDKEKNPFAVKPAALQVVCSQRIYELAKPKRLKTLFTETDSSSFCTEGPESTEIVLPKTPALNPISTTNTSIASPKKQPNPGNLVPYILTGKNLQDYYERN